MSLKNPTFNELAQAAHALAGYGLILTAARIGHVAIIVVCLLLVVYAAIKEFWFDMRYERPEVSGGFKGGVEDFSFYMIGMVVGLIVLRI
jgi:hypothetical protein